MCVISLGSTQFALFSVCNIEVVSAPDKPRICLFTLFIQPRYATELN